MAVVVCFDCLTGEPEESDRRALGNLLVAVSSSLSGQPLSDAVVRLSAAGGRGSEIFGRTAEDGVALLRDIVRGTYSLTVEAADFVPSRRRVTVEGTSEIQMGLERAAWVFIQVEWPEELKSRDVNDCTLFLVVRRLVEGSIPEQWEKVGQVRKIADLRLNEHARLRVPPGNILVEYQLERGELGVSGVRNHAVGAGQTVEIRLAWEES